MRPCLILCAINIQLVGIITIYECYLPTLANQIIGSESDILMVEEGNDDSVERPSMSPNYLSASLFLVPLDARKCNFIAEDVVLNVDNDPH